MKLPIPVSAGEALECYTSPGQLTKCGPEHYYCKVGNIASNTTGRSHQLHNDCTFKRVLRFFKFMQFSCCGSFIENVVPLGVRTTDRRTTIYVGRMCH